MKHSNFYRAILGGFLGTLVMTALLYLAPLAGAPKADIAALLGSFFGHGIPAIMTGWWWAGMVWHFVNGTIVFSLIYAYLVYGWMAGENWFRGLVWGVVLWLAMEVILMPITGKGVFGDHATMQITRAVVAFIVFGMYGAVLGAVAGAQPEHRHHHVAHPA
jgi:uncharacterized membrane protein YagU involved in acid resistance